MYSSPLMTDVPQGNQSATHMGVGGYIPRVLGYLPHLGQNWLVASPIDTFSVFGSLGGQYVIVTTCALLRQAACPQSFLACVGNPTTNKKKKRVQSPLFCTNKVEGSTLLVDQLSDRDGEPPVFHVHVQTLLLPRVT